MDIKKILTHKAFTSASAGILTFLLTLLLVGRNPTEKMEDKQDATVYVTEVSVNNDSKTTKRVLNREYFDPATIPVANWADTISNAEIARVFGEICAKEMAFDIDSINRRLATPGKLFGLDYNYCNKRVTTAIVEASKRMNFRHSKQIAQARPFAKSKGRRDALYNGDMLVQYFASDSIPNTIIYNPSIADFKKISVGSVVRFSNHSKMFIGIGFVDGSGKTFVPSPDGKPVIASGYNERFSYYSEGCSCIVVDVPKVVEHKLKTVGRQR